MAVHKYGGSLRVFKMSRFLTILELKYVCKIITVGLRYADRLIGFQKALRQQAAAE